MSKDDRSSGNGLLASYTLAERELKRFIRQRNRVFGALLQPIIFWALFGSGLSASFRAGGAEIDYTEYFFPGTVVLILLFTAIFATISIIDDRAEGFLQAVLVAPISTESIVLGKLAGTTVLAVGQALLVFALAPLGGITLSLTSFLLSLPVLLLIGFALAGLGFTIAWNMDSTQGFHAVMTAFLMPMWFLSGAFFPATGAPSWLGWVIALNPLTYGVAALRHILYLGRPELVADLPGLLPSLVVLVVFVALSLSAAVLSAKRTEQSA